MAVAGRMVGLIEGFLHRRVLRRWAQIADQADQADLETLQVMRERARGLRRNLNRVIHQAEHRLARPVIGSNLIRKPMGSDWAWRPELWKGQIPVPGFCSASGNVQLCDGATMFHDCRWSELTARQIRNTRAVDIAPFGFQVDLFQFDGSFLSLAIDLPEDGARGLKLKHLVRMDVIVEMEKPLEFFARLNVKHGSNVEQIFHELPLNEENVAVEFDLAHSKLDEKRIEKLWVDLIFKAPGMNQIILRDVTFSRRPRVEF